MIETRALRRVFGSVVAVDDVSLTVPDGTILALLGPNGAGKSTTVRLLAGLLAPSAGHARVAGHDVLTEPAAVRARVGLVTDTPGLHDQMTPLSYLDFFGRVYGVPPGERRARIDQLLQLFDLSDVGRVRMARFSRGMQQKVAIARALVHDPAVVFFDEPTAGLDPLAARTVRELILRLKDARRSIVLCTHDLDEAERLADRVAIVAHGRIVAADSAAALRAGASRETLVQIVLAQPCEWAGLVAERVAGVVEPALSSSSPGACLVYRTVNPAQTNPAVIAGLVQAGAAVVSVTCASATLEDVYAAAVADVTVGTSASELAGARA